MLKRKIEQSLIKRKHKEDGTQYDILQGNLYGCNAVPPDL